MVRDRAITSVLCSVTYLTALALLLGCAADGTVLPKPEKDFPGPPQKEQEFYHQQQLNTSAINTALAFEPYHDLATRTGAEHGVHLQQRNILFSPLGLASALALLSRVSGSQSRSQALEALGLAANATEQSVEATISALTDLHHRLTLQQGGGGGVQSAGSEAAAETGVRATGGVETRGAKAGHTADVNDGTKNGTGAEDGVHAGGQLRMWSGLHADGKPSLTYDRFLSRPQLTGSSASNLSLETLRKDLQASDKLSLNNYVYFKGRQPFERRHTAPRSFQLNSTTNVEVAMMFRDDSSDVMMLYDTNCSATVVRLAESGRMASLLLLPKADMQILEDCLSDSRMNFWLNNLKRGRAEILFPKFQLRKSYSFERLLKTSGVSSMFSDSADFTRISQKKRLKLKKAHHEVMLEVEETKSEEGGRPDVTLDFSVPPRITFNRPFMLIIYDCLTGLVLLMGRIIDPTDV